MSSPGDFVSMPWLIEKFGLRIMVETGTGNGDNALLAAEAFDIVYTIDKKEAPRDFSGHPVAFRRGRSADVLPRVLEELPDWPTFWWLDAHDYPGDLPLVAELTAIRDSGRDCSGDVFLIDDWRMYEHGPYVSGMLSPPPARHDAVSVRYLLQEIRARVRLQTLYSAEGALLSMPRFTP